MGVRQRPGYSIRGMSACHIITAVIQSCFQIFTSEEAELPRHVVADFLEKIYGLTNAILESVV